MRHIAIAGIQMRIHHGRDNVPAIVARIDETMLRFPWVQMVAVSELASFGAQLADAITLPGPVEETYQALAARHRIWLIPGSVFERAGDGNIYNTAPVIGPDGKIVARCRKLFPFCPYESGVTGGTEFCVFDVPAIGRFGLSICYDSWFPEVARTLTAMGAEVLLQPVLTDTTDRDLELSIARSTAAQFQVHVVNINGIGDGGLGRSCIVDCAGQVLYIAGADEETIPVELDLDQVSRQRERGIRGLGQVMKSFRDRRVDFPVYDRTSGLAQSLAALGPLRMPDRGS